MKTKFVAAVLMEAVAGVRESDVNMSGAKPVYAEDDVMIPDTEMTRREFKPLASFGGYKVVTFFKAWASMKFSIVRPLPLSVAVFDGSDIDILLQASGHSRVPVYQTPGDDTTPIAAYEYQPETFNTKTMSVDIIGEELMFKGHGAKAAFKLTAKAGDPVMVTFDVSAAYDDAPAGAYTVPFLTPPEAAMVDENDIYGHVKIGATEGAAVRSQIDEFSLDMGAEIERKKTYKERPFRVKNFAPTVSLKGDVDAENPYSIDAVLDGTSKALVIRIKDRNDLSIPADATSGKVKWEIVVPGMTPDKVPSLNDQDGLGYLDQVFNANPTAGNDNYVLRYFL